MGLEALDARRIASPVAVILEVYGLGVKSHEAGAHDVDGDELAVLGEHRSAGVAVVGAARDAVHGGDLAGIDVVALGDDLHTCHL